jgi:hypothetical protein
MSGSEDRHIAEVFGGQGLPEHAFLPRRTLKPWHKPRKQWIRRNQWLKEFADLCAFLDFREKRPLRYLSLPGEDLLDIRILRECCATKGLKLKYLGLNDEHASDEPNTWLHVAWNQVNAMDGIHRDSVVIRDRFEEIADQNSKAFQYVQQYGPFDVVNLDLCESISPLKSKQKNYYAALEALADFQNKSRAPNQPWLLLITSRVGGPWVSPSDMDKLAKCVGTNISANKSFAERLEQMVPKVSVLASAKVADWKSLLQPHFVNLFSVGLGKWLLKMLSSARPQWGVRLVGSYSYRVAAESPDMVSLAFVIEGYPGRPVDTFGLSQGAMVNAVNYDEPSLALSLLDGVRQIVDIDQKLATERSVYTAMEDETFNLLVSARYKPDLVRKGLAKFARSAHGGRLH